MKKLVRIIGISVAIIFLLLAVAATYIQITGIPSYETQSPAIQLPTDSASLAHGEALAKIICASCHMNKAGDRLSGSQMTDASEEFGTIYSANITHSKYGLDRYSDGELLYLLRTGIKRDGQYSPPWMVKLPLMSDKDITSIIAYLRSDDDILKGVDKPAPPSEPSFLVKFLSHVAFKPLPYPEKPILAPPVENTEAYGRYLAVGRYDCFGCHSADFKTVDPMVPENSEGFFGGGNPLTNEAGELVPSANLTPDLETGIGGWTEEEFANAVRSGIRNGKPGLSTVMPRFTTMTDQEVHALYTYLKSIPPLKKEITRYAGI